MSTISKRRPQPPEYVKETEKIKENKKTYAGTVHKFKPAQWTHPNGHPRCLLCGDEQPISPECGRDATPEEEKAFQDKLDAEFGSIGKAKNPLWDGDGVQGIGQPRGKGGRWRDGLSIDIGMSDIKFSGKGWKCKKAGCDNKATVTVHHGKSRGGSGLCPSHGIETVVRSRLAVLVKGTAAATYPSNGEDKAKSLMNSGPNGLLSKKSGKLFLGSKEIKIPSTTPKKEVPKKKKKVEVSSGADPYEGLISRSIKSFTMTSREKAEVKPLSPDNKKIYQTLRRRYGFGHVRALKYINNISKSLNPLWDGDGVQGAGQPRDRRGRWVRLPGPTDIARIAIFDLDDGTFGVFKDDDRRPLKKYKRHQSANRFVADLIKADRDAYVEEEKERKKANAALKRKATIERKKREAAEAERKSEDEKRRKEQEKIFGAPKPAKGTKPKSLQQKKPKPKNSSRVTYGEVDRLPFPGRPTAQQISDLNKWAKENMPDNESKYAGLIARLLLRRGITQDPAVRGSMAKKYGVSAGRLVQIEQDVHEQLFPSNVPKPRKRNLAGSSVNISPKQEENMLKLGAYSAHPEAAPNDVRRPSRVFKINKGPKKGRWAKIDWVGNVELVTKKDAEKNIGESKAWWTRHLLGKKTYREKLRKQYKQAQSDLLETHLANTQARKKWKIKRAKVWAEQEGFDPNDSYWWALFWNDPTLLSSSSEQEELADPNARQLRYNPGPVLEQAKMDPALLEGILAMPDIDSRKMRGQRPGPNKPMKGDEDFVPASPETREGDPEWESRNRDRNIEFDRRMRLRFDAYKKKHPKSKLTLEEFAENYWNNKMRIPGGVKKAKNPIWDGDGVQGIGQPRNRHGRWSRGGALSGIAGELIPRDALQHHSTGSPRRAGGSSKAGVFDHKKKTLAPGVKLTRLPHQGIHRLTSQGKPIARKLMTPEEALYARNNGTTKITNKRLAEIHRDRSKLTQTEINLLTNAGAQKHIDGDENVKVWVVREGKFKPRPRFSVIANLRKEIANDIARKEGGERGVGGHIMRRDDIDAKKKLAENKKRVSSGRNKVNKETRQQLIEDFGDGKTAKCIFCGKKVDADRVSPERMKPGPIGGKYERGNMAPSHEACNTKMGTAAQHSPDKYYEEMMKRFLLVYDEWIQEGYLGFVFNKNRGKLQGKRPKTK